VYLKDKDITTVLLLFKNGCLPKPYVFIYYDGCPYNCFLQAFEQINACAALTSLLAVFDSNPFEPVTLFAAAKKE
jgi:hypothetical protein